MNYRQSLYEHYIFYLYENKFGSWLITDGLHDFISNRVCNTKCKSGCVSGTIFKKQLSIDRFMQI